MIKRGILFLLVIFLLANISYAAYYADVTIDVSTDGLVEISGNSNHPLLQTGVYDNLTSKKDGYWILNISTKEKFSSYSYELNLPKNIRINYLNIYSIDTFEDDGNFHISGSAEYRPFVIQLQYRQSMIKSSYLWIIGLFILFTAVLSYFILRKRSKKYIKDLFTEREYKIIILLKKKRCMTQSELVKKIGLPKTSLHRALTSLEKKGVIQKHKTGMTNKVCLK